MSLPANRPRWSQIAVSLLVVTLGLAGAHTLNRIDQDLRIMYTEYTLAATDLAHVLADIMRYRNVIIRSMETQTKKDFDRITAALPQLRARIEGIIERFAAASMKVRNRGHEPPELQAVRDSLDEYFAASDRTLALLTQIWAARSPAEAAELRSRAERNVAEQAGTKLVQVTLATDALLDSVAKVGRELREQGSGLIRGTSLALLVGSFILACANMLIGASSSAPPASRSGLVSIREDGAGGEGKPSVPAYYSVGRRGSDSDRLS